MTSKSRLVSFFAGFILLAADARGQKAANWRSYKAADGMADSVTLSVTVSPRGKLWVKHPGGESASWLDGYEVGTIPSPGPGNYRIYESPGGQVWSMSSDGLQLYKDDHWITFTLASVSTNQAGNSSFPQPISLYPLKQNHVLYLTSAGLFEFNADNPSRPESILVRASKDSSIKQFTSMTPANGGGLWIGGANGLAKLSGPLEKLAKSTEWSEYPLEAALHVRNLHELAEDEIGGVTALVESADGTRQSAAHFDGGQWSIAVAELPERTLRVWRGLDGIWWILTPFSLLQWAGGESQLVPDEEMSARRYFDAAVEPRGVFWLATSDGLLRHAPLAWRPPASTPRLNSPVRSVVEDKSGRIWIASAASLDALETNHWRHYALPETALGDYQAGHCLYALTNGTIVIASGESMFQLNPSSGVFSPLGPPGRSSLRPVGQLQDGLLCIQAINPVEGAQTNRLELYDGVSFRSFPHPLPDTWLGSDLLIIPGSPIESFWLAGSRNLAWFHDNKWQVFPLPGSTVAQAPSCMIELAEGRIWCGIQDRIWDFNGKSWSLIRSGVDRVNALLKARDGSVWAAADSGVHRFFHAYWGVNGMDEGLPATIVRDIFEDHAGGIWAATTHGLSIYHPSADPDPPKTSIQDLPEPKNTAREGTLIDVRFNGRDKWKYTPMNRLLFSYRLDQGDWSPMQEERSVPLPDLRAGKHYFQARCMDRNWNVDADPPKLEFAITLPWYKESRLMAISSAGLAAAIFFAAVAFNRHRRLIRSYAEIEAKVALRTSQLEAAGQELLHSQKMNALGTLAAGIAHDFNNILSIIKGSAQIIEDNLDNPDKVRTRTSRIKTVVEQGAGIVNAMLGFSRQTGQELTLCDVNAIVSETIQLLGDRFVRELEVRFEPGQSIPEVSASKDFIQQILLNFIFNAADAMNGRGRVVLSTRQSRHLPRVLALTPAASASYVFLSVQDFGSGIPPEIIQRIFEPFFTTKSFSTRRGTGLGLSMAYELARQMDCGLAVESVVGHGSTFSLIIPVRSDTENSPDSSK